VPRIVFVLGVFSVSFRFFALASLILAAGCHFQSDAPGDAPTGVAVTPGDGLVTVSFDQQADLTYWIFYRAGGVVAPDSPGVSVFRDAISPQVLSRLVVGALLNGTQYAFLMNATRSDSKAGPNSAIVVGTPRLAGVNWDVGAALGAVPQNLNGLAFSGSRLVAVGNAGTVFEGDYKYASATPPGVTAWLAPTTFPTGFTANLSAVTFSAQFVALASNGSILTSPDGLTWTLVQQKVNASLGTGMNSIAFGLGLYVAVGNGGSLFASGDLVTWTALDSHTLNDLYSVSFTGGFVATGANGTLVTSPQGGTWNVQNSGTPNALRGAAFGALTTGPRYVVVGDAGTIVTSPDGINWSPISPPLAASFTSVVFGSRFLAVGQGGAVAYSDDGVNWTETTASTNLDLSRVVFTPGMYVAVGVAGANAVSK